jgi:hypothetical protein
MRVVRKAPVSFAMILAAVPAAILAVASIPAAAQELPRTGAETVSFERHTSHDELMSFLYDVQAQSDRMLIRELAVTNEGRVMPLVILGSPPMATPGAAWFSGKPTVFFTGNVHGNERAGREGSLQLIRELAAGELRPLLDRVNVLIVPTLNPDGAEHRTRTNSRGYDMNRDFIVAETPEISGILEGVLTEWWPDIYVDVHNGGAYPYNVTYQATLHPAADAELVAFARGPLFEGVQQHLGTQDMITYWYSGPRRNAETGDWTWQTTEPWARKQHTYGGLQNMVTLLFEIPGRWTLGEQAANAREAMTGLLQYAADNATTLRNVVVDARRRTLQQPAQQVVIATEERAYPEPEQFYVMEQGQSEPQLVTGENRTLYVASQTRAAPWAYAFEERLGDIARFLQRHSIVVEQLEAPVTVQAERFRLDSIAWSESPYQNHLNADAAVTAVPESIELPAGTYLVRMSQNAARLVAELFEPDTEDSLVAWNFLDHSLPQAGSLANRREPYFLPMVRVMQPAGVRSTVID